MFADSNLESILAPKSLPIIGQKLLPESSQRPFQFIMILMTKNFKLSVLLIPININIELLQNKKKKKVSCHIVPSCMGRELNPGPSSLLPTLANDLMH